jgi:hypothetical protein
MIGIRGLAHPSEHSDGEAVPQRGITLLPIMFNRRHSGGLYCRIVGLRKLFYVSRKIFRKVGFVGVGAKIPLR